jgi:hypothetical protein
MIFDRPWNFQCSMFCVAGLRGAFPLLSFSVDLPFFLHAIDVFLDRFNFILQIFQMFPESGDFLLFGHETRPVLKRIITSAETGMMMSPTLKSVMTAGSTTHMLTSFHICNCEY